MVSSSCYRSACGPRGKLNAERRTQNVERCVALTGSLQTLTRPNEHKEDIEADDSVVAHVARLWKENAKPWVSVVDGGSIYDAMARQLELAGIPTFRTSDRALRLFARWCEWTHSRR